MNYAVVLFFDERPCGYEVTEQGGQVCFRPALHRRSPDPGLPELKASPAGDGWLLEGSEDPSIRIQVGRLLTAHHLHTSRRA